MNSGFRLRLLLLFGAICVVAGLTLWGVERSWTRVNALERRLTREQLLSFRLADDFQQHLLRLNNSVLQFAFRREPARWAEFEQSSGGLDRWIDEQIAKLNTVRERSILNQLKAAYDDYLAAARRLHTNRAPASLSADVFAELDGFEQQAQRLLHLDAQLADAHREAEKSFLEEANRSLDSLRWLLFAGVALLLGMMGALAWLLYRDLIAPLRTRLVEREALLERQEKLATLGTLASGIAHEIRNPLTSIKARLYTLGKHIRGNEAGSSDAAVISDEISRLERIVQDVLRFARPSDPELRVVSANIPLREVQSLLSASLDPSRVQLRFEPGPELHVSIDPSLIKQVLINLVRNAAEAIEQQGTVTLRVRAARRNLQDRECAVAILEVADTGKGIPPEVGKRLFDPFFTTKEAGTGLGLPIAARIVEKHGGALQYQTRVGHGTTFGIVLPLASSQAVKMEQNEVANRRTSNVAP
jgi:signal transduction histidine kinase